MAGPYRSKDEPGSSQEETRRTDRQMVYRGRTIFKLVGTTKLSPLLTWNTRVWKTILWYFAPPLQHLVLTCAVAQRLLNKQPNTAKGATVINWPISSSLSVRRRNRKPQISRDQSWHNYSSKTIIYPQRSRHSTRNMNMGRHRRVGS
jgi:hypothetical protein